MGCACKGGATAGEQYEAVAGDGTILAINGTRMSGTVEEARAAVAGRAGGWVRKAGGAR